MGFMFWDCVTCCAVSPFVVSIHTLKFGRRSMLQVPYNVRECYPVGLRKKAFSVVLTLWNIIHPEIRFDPILLVFQKASKTWFCHNVLGPRYLIGLCHGCFNCCYLFFAWLPHMLLCYMVCYLIFKYF